MITLLLHFLQMEEYFKLNTQRRQSKIVGNYLTKEDRWFLMLCKVCAGLIADGRHLVNRAKEEASVHKKNFESKIPGKVNLKCDDIC